MNQLQSLKTPDAAKFWNDASTRYTQLSRMRGTPGEQRNLALQQARNYLTGKVKSLITPELGAAIDQTAHMSWLWNWEAEDSTYGTSQHKNIASKIIYDPPQSKDQPGTIVLQGLNFGNSAVANKIKAAMGSWMHASERLSNPDNPKSVKTWDTYVRATKESWQRFLDLSPLWLDEYEQLASAPAIANKRFPPESQFGGSIHPYDKQKSSLELQVSLINFIGKPGVEEWELKGKNKINPQGVRLQFGANDPNFERIRDILVRPTELGLEKVNPYPSQFRFDIYDLNPKKLTILSQKLQGMGYPTTEFNSIMTQATGKNIGEIREQLTQKKITTDISPQVIQNANAKNLKTRIDIDLHSFRQQVLQRYPAAFNPTKSPPEMQKAQQEGMYFVTQRAVSVLADEPGSGKGVQVACGCDFVTPNDKKILVLTPPSLVNENWGSKVRQSVPEQFCGYSPDMVARCRSNEDFLKAIQSPARWIVIPYSSFKSRNDSNLLATSIATAANNGLFGSCMLDEIQMIKRLKSNTGDLIRKAIPESIPYRVGMTGTPADNDPSDIYSQLRLLRHPVLFEDGSIRQSEKGFAEQFVGGKDSADTSDTPFARATAVISWAKNISPEKRLAMLDLFSTTFLRRNKEDIRHDLPDKITEPAQIETDVSRWDTRQKQLKQEQKEKTLAIGKTQKSWSQSLLEEMGREKIPYTVKTAVHHLQNDNNSKVFIVTAHPEFAEAISSQINEIIGDGTSAAVSGETADSHKAIVPNIFKIPLTDGPQKSILPGKQYPLRCVVYTMGVGAVGLNFSVANKCIFNDTSWNPSINLQAEFRIDRLDTRHPISIQYMVLQGTYDETMYDRVQQKGNLNQAANEVLRRVDEARQNPAMKNQLAIDYLLSVVDSVIIDLPPLNPAEQIFIHKEEENMRSFLQNQIQPRSIAAKTWYKTFKDSTLQYRQLW